MPAFLILDSISLATPDGRPLFDGLTLTLGRERTGVVGLGKGNLVGAGLSRPSLYFVSLKIRSA